MNLGLHLSPATLGVFETTNKFLAVTVMLSLPVKKKVQDSDFYFLWKIKKKNKKHLKDLDIR